MEKIPTTIRVSEDNYAWLDSQRKKLNEKKRESFNDVLDRWKKVKRGD
jgi:predicted CopG family antitoxin